MRLEHHLVGGYVRYISPHIIIIIIELFIFKFEWYQIHVTEWKETQNWNLVSFNVYISYFQIIKLYGMPYLL